MTKYINVQMNIETHALVKEHCKTSKQTISGCIEKLVLDNLKSNKSITANVLKVTSKQ